MTTKHCEREIEIELFGRLFHAEVHFEERPARAHDDHRQAVTIVGDVFEVGEDGKYAACNPALTKHEQRALVLLMTEHYDERLQGEDEAAYERRMEGR